MPAHVIVGMQWGDEGKGRIADWFAAQSDIVARYAGGDNAGHTVRVGDETFKLHLVPSGVLHKGVRCVMGGGMAINPLGLAEELRDLDRRGVDISQDRITLASTAHLVTPAHIALDGANEAARGEEAIGTTKRGIGPAYTDKAARIGLRAWLMGEPDRLAARLRDHIEQSNRLLTKVYDLEAIEADPIIDEIVAAAGFLAPYLGNVPLLLHGALAEGKRVLCEGAQGTLLDIDHGVYPYVTSSSTTAGGAIAGLGIGPRHIERVSGVAKAYSTRVGEGPFPTELHDERADRLRGTGANPWDEYGTTTGRPRRCGWLDALVLRYAARINGVTDIVITKLDILSGFEQLEIASSYSHKGEVLTDLPPAPEALLDCRPSYCSLPGWSEDIMTMHEFHTLPRAARDYIGCIEEFVYTPVSLITVGPARDQTVTLS